jgi:hypothetical protein
MKLRLIPVFLLLGLTLLAQQQDIVGLTDFPVPAWPQDGIVPESMKDNYVFIDLPKNEYVVAYPENLGTDSFKDGPGKMKISRYDLLRGVAPSITVAISPANGSGFKYAYSISNESSAKQSIDQWILDLSGDSANDLIQHPDGWFGIVQRNRSFKVRNPEWILTGTAAIWSFEKSEQVIAPGASKKGFEIESELRPGFTVAYVRNSESVDAKVTTQGNIPREVKDQLDQLLLVEYNSRTVLTIGPKFNAKVDDHAIAEDFIQGIFTLSRSGELDLNSDFVRNALSELTAVKPGAAAAGIVKLATPPNTPVETSLVNALKVSLKL